MKLKMYDGFQTKAQAKHAAIGLRKQGIQYVQVKPIKQGRLRYGVYLGGRKSSMYV